MYCVLNEEIVILHPVANLNIDQHVSETVEFNLFSNMLCFNTLFLIFDVDQIILFFPAVFFHPGFQRRI